jgi:hypothetical protein
MVYSALLPLMRTPQLPAVDWTDAPADLNGLVRFAERRNLVSARVPSHFKRSLPSYYIHIQATFRGISVSPRNGYRSETNLILKWWRIILNNLKKVHRTLTSYFGGPGFKSWPWISTSWLRLIVVLLTPSRQNVKFEDHRFLPHPFQFMEPYRTRYRQQRLVFRKHCGPFHSWHS